MKERGKNVVSFFFSWVFALSHKIKWVVGVQSRVTSRSSLGLKIMGRDKVKGKRKDCGFFFLFFGF